MDHLSRLIASVVLLAFAAAVSAADCTVFRATGSKYPTGTATATALTASAACSAIAGQMGGSFDSGPVHVTVSYSFSRVEGSFCVGMRAQTTTIDGGGPPSNSDNPDAVWATVGDEVVECSQTCAAKAGTAPKPTNPQNTSYIYDGGTGAAPATKTAGCDAGTSCGVTGANAIQVADQDSTGKWWVQTPMDQWKFSGASCGVTPQTPEVKPSTCAKGEVPGTFNGTAICLKSEATTNEQAASSAASSPAGSDQKTIITKTECRENVCVTTTTTTTTNSTSGGNGTNVQTTTQSQSQLCAKEPSNPVCKPGSGGGGPGGGGDEEGSAFGGTCASTTCTGDAIQCAIAQEQAKRACEMKENFGDGSRTHALAVAGDEALTAGDTPGEHPRNASKVVAGGDLSTGFDQSRLIGGSCPGDRMVGPVLVKFSVMCGPAEWIGNLMVGICALACLGIVFRS